MAGLKEWLWLTTRKGLPREGAFGLLERFGFPEAAYYADPAQYAGLPPQCRESLLDKSMDGPDRILADCERLGIRILTMQDAEYPERLKQIYGPPCVLYVRGRLFPIDPLPTVAVVGTRTPSEYGKRLAFALGLELTRAGVLVVSGMAQGLDSAAIHGALQAGGRVVSVLGNGVDVIYPARNRELYEDVAAAGVLVSEYPPGTAAEGWHFPVRNRILSGLSSGVVIVEGGDRSGALITARLALEQDREVFAVPGLADAPMSRGPNLLIQRGEAKLILCTEDILCELEGQFPGQLNYFSALEPQVARERLAAALERSREAEPEREEGREKSGKTVDKEKKRAYITIGSREDHFSEDERRILLCLGEKRLSADEIVERAQIPARRVSAALTMLQVGEWIEEAPGRRFCARVILRAEDET